MTTCNEIKAELQQCTGTEHYWYRPSIFGTRTGMVYTDGVKQFCKLTESQWFIDLVNSYMPEIINENLKAGDYFTIITLVVKPITEGKHKGCNLQVKMQHDTNTPILFEQYDVTDIPEGEYKFYLVDNDKEKVLMLPTEY